MCKGRVYVNEECATQLTIWMPDKVALTCFVFCCATEVYKKLSHTVSQTSTSFCHLNVQCNNSFSVFQPLYLHWIFLFPWWLETTQLHPISNIRLHFTQKLVTVINKKMFNFITSKVLAYQETYLKKVLKRFYSQKFKILEWYQNLFQTM